MTYAVDFGRDICGDFDVSTRREWLVINGLGGYASGTVADVLTRRYHGLLVAALEPPGGRTLMLSKLEASVAYDGEEIALYANRWASGLREREGAGRIERFWLEGRIPCWRYSFADALIEKRVWMRNYENTTYVQYRMLRGGFPARFSVRALVSYRDHHHVTFSGDWRMNITTVPGGVKVAAFDEAVPFYLLSKEAAAQPRHIWYKDFFLSMEAFRGLEAHDDHLCAVEFTATLKPGASFSITASTEAKPELNAEKMLEERREHEQTLINASQYEDAPPQVQQLVLAANQFIVKRPQPDNPEGRSVIAGYHWFGDWGRDTMIALPGLTLATGRTEYARLILRTFAGFVQDGLLPNYLPERGKEPEYNAIDAALWYFEAIRAYHEATGDDDLVRELFPVLKEIVTAYSQGTRYNIKVDPADGLVGGGQEGVQLTWMDAIVDGDVVTPRAGKPVEVNALWYNALMIMADFARLLDENSAEFDKAAAKAKKGFGRFWNEAAGYCFDVLDGPSGSDPALRPNQIIAVSLPHSPLTKARQKAIVDVCARHLLTSFGLRSLAPNDPAYLGTYGGDQRKRDAAYHQGAVWAWLIGPFVRAHLVVYRDRRTARSFLEPLLNDITSFGLGTVGEIFEGDPPYGARGCIAMAWSVAEVLRAWEETK